MSRVKVKGQLYENLIFAHNFASISDTGLIFGMNIQLTVAIWNSDKSISCMCQSKQKVPVMRATILIASSLNLDQTPSEHGVHTACILSSLWIAHLDKRAMIALVRLPEL